MTQKHDGGHHTHNYHPNSDPDIARRLARIEWALCKLLSLNDKLLGKVDDIMADFTAWETELQGISDAEDAVEALITKLIEETKNNGADQNKINQFTTQLTALKSRLAAAVVSGTPADPAPEPTA